MKNDEKNALRGLGKAFIALGLVLLGIKLDLLGLGSPHEYYRWEMIFAFFSIFSLLNLHLVASLVFFAIGAYFIAPDINVQIPQIAKTLFWPTLLILAGIEFILKPLLFKKR